MPGIRKQYPFDLIEPKWQQYWEQQQSFRAWNPGERIPSDHPFAIRHGLGGARPEPGDLPPKSYILDMFPYPSGAGLHVGHPEGYTATDILARYQRARGLHVLHPFGWDAFGLPAEQYAIKTGQHPRATTAKNIATFKRQIQALGFSYDWTREIDTTDPAYFRWTQWIFLQLYHAWFNPATNRAEPIATLTYPETCANEADRRAYRDAKRLAYVSEAPVWWCEALGTVLANEEVIDGKSEVGDHPVTRRPMRQWMLRITAYAQRLIDDLALLDWSDSLIEMQRNWIGRSEGAEIDFPAADTEERIRVFTTRPDTLFGATYMVLAPEHPLVDRLTIPNRKAAVEAYRTQTANKSDLERAELNKEKTGVPTGAFAINPATEQPIPIWIADYVLLTYGSGAIMAVPGHDTRDLEFAEKFNLPVVQVVQPPASEQDWRGFTGDGVSVNSTGRLVSLDGLPTPQAKQRIIAWLEDRGDGKRTVNYKLRDWLFSRQRYWGEPFPIVWRNGLHEALPEASLPVAPPPLEEFKPTPDGQPPLARATDWVSFGDGAERETNTMPQWAGSCWYYLRYLDPRNERTFVGTDAESYWMAGQPATPDPHSPEVPRKAARAGVDLYVGGAEHAVLHLLYARFWHKTLYDLGHVSTPEPFRRLVNQGLILGEDNQKMSKSRGNVVNPDEILAEYGADAFRLYEMFMGPLQDAKPWNTRGVEGVYRFLGRVWRLLVDDSSETEFEQRAAAEPGRAATHLEGIRLQPAVKDLPPRPEQLKVLHACLKKVTEDLEAMRFNTAISAMMVFTNEATRWTEKPFAALRPFLQVLAPFAPHVAEELWDKLHRHVGQTAPSLSYETWPAYDPAILAEETVEIPVQVNGKVRQVLRVPADATNQQLEEAALAAEKVQPFTAGKRIRKVVVVPKRLVNIAVS